MTRTDVVSAPAVRAIIDRGLDGRAAFPPGLADDLEFV
jgi:hypothetical protein